MSAIIFLALQCVQCSTMQVKQRKNSSNKWTCVVCNQKQSVLRVFAQGPKAKDLRFFVQSFNMSRKIADENQPSAAITEYNIELEAAGDDGGGDLEISDRRKRRTDWTAYLDPEDHQEDEDLIKQEEEGGVFEPKVVTELPKKMFKKPKLRNYGGREGSNDSYKPVFSNRNASASANTNAQGYSQNEANTMKCQGTREKAGSMWSESMAETRKESRTRKSVPATRTSKWNDYITPDDDAGGDCDDDGSFQLQIAHSASQKVSKDFPMPAAVD